MQEFQDSELLRQYVRGNSDEAFAALVSRHVNMVYSAALRKTSNPAAAEEITQAVFVILARRASGLLRHTALSGWLYQAARLTAANFLRTEIRRARREQEACVQSFSNQTEPELWPQIMPLLEDAMGRLGEKDRDTLTLRFFESKSFQEIGTVFGVSENAARKRTTYALEKLRAYFSKRGVTSTTEAIAGAISAHSVHAAPAMLGTTATAVALTKGATASASTLTLIKGVLKIMAWAKAKTIAATIVVAVILAGSTTGVVEYKIIQTNRHTGNVSMEDDIQTDGTVHARVTLEVINTANRTVTPTDTWTMSNPIDIQRLTDDEGQPIRFTRKPAVNGQFEYTSFLTRPVPPGKKFTAKMEGTVDGLGIGEIKPTSKPGEFEFYDGETASAYIMHCIYNYQLPPGAVLLNKTPNLKEVANGDRIVVRFDQVLSPRASAGFHFRYRLASAVQ